VIKKSSYQNLKKSGWIEPAHFLHQVRMKELQKTLVIFKR